MLRLTTMLIRRTPAHKIALLQFHNLIMIKLPGCQTLGAENHSIARLFVYRSLPITPIASTMPWLHSEPLA